LLAPADTNIAGALSKMAARIPDETALVAPNGTKGGEPQYISLTYQELEQRSNQAAHGLCDLGISEGCRVVLMVKPSIDLFTLVFAIFKAGAVPVLVDPGIGLKYLKQCIGEAEPEAFIGIPPAHVARLILGWGKATIKTKLWVGGKLSFGLPTLNGLIQKHADKTTFEIKAQAPGTTAAILFTSGSTGVPKGVVYTHETFLAQVESIREMFKIEPGDVDLPTFPLFALFDPALGMTTIIPDMDPTRPAQADPTKLIGAIERFKVTTMFGSPALLNTLGRYAEANQVKLPTLKRVLSAGAPMPAPTIQRIKNMMADDGQLFPPYGATESLPVAYLEANEVLNDTWANTEQGAGICVGRPVPQIRTRIIPTDDGALSDFSQTTDCPVGTIGEITVSGPMVTASYFKRDEATQLAKIKDAEGHVWHRMGDLGYFDDQGRLWFCGRKSHRVQPSEDLTLYTTQVEALFNNHPDVFRSALVGIGARPTQKPVICIEMEKRASMSWAALKGALEEIARGHELTRGIDTFLLHPQFPVDIRHNAKIGRPQLAQWAKGRLS